jgi:hypothetical protein
MELDRLELDEKYEESVRRAVITKVLPFLSNPAGSPSIFVTKTGQSTWVNLEDGNGGRGMTDDNVHGASLSCSYVAEEFRTLSKQYYRR